MLSVLAAESDTEGATTTVDALVATVDATKSEVADHVDALVDCDLAVRTDDGVRVSVTGEQLLAMDVDGQVILDLDGC